MSSRRRLHHFNVGERALTKFEQFYFETKLVSGVTAASKLSELVTAPAGVYSTGLITIFDEDLGGRILNEWQWLLVDAIGLAATWQGNVFFWSSKHKATFYLDSQTGKATFVDESVDRLFNSFLVQPGIQRDVLLDKHYEEIQRRLGNLEYCECFIAKPWPMLGGSGDSETFVKGDVEVYLSLTGQTIRRFATN